MDRYDLIIVGAGISGLSLAHYCAKSGVRTLVLEKNLKAGGCFHSHRLEDGSGFWMELGSHTCYNSYGNLLGLMEDCGILGRLIKREKVGYRMLVDNQVKSIPSQINFVEILLSVPRLFALKKAGQSIESYYSKIVGKTNYKRVFAPAFNAVICQEADNFPAEMLFKKRPRRKGILKSFTLAGGLQTIIESLASQKGVTLLTGREVQSASAKSYGFDVAVADGGRFEAHALAMAIPPTEAATLLRPFFPDLSARLSRIGVVSVETVGAVVRKDALSLCPLAGIIAVEDSFFSAVSRDTVPHATHRGFSFHFKPRCVDQDAKLTRISEVLGVRPGQIEHVVSKENFVPAPIVGHDVLIGDIDRLLAGKKLLLTGNYFSGLAIEDCVSRSLAEASRLKGMLEGSRPGW
ncbi:MAG: FAD-dependent oxidoreductase [Thermodesulfovibrionales bacterium]